MQIRPAVESDQKTIEGIIHAVHINPMDVRWQHFLVAEEAGRVAGIGQIKRHGDGSRELASIAVIPELRSQGIASEIIRTLLQGQMGTLYLTCLEPRQGFYERFGFRRIGRNEMPPYFRRLDRIAPWFMRLNRQKVGMIVMKRPG